MVHGWKRVAGALTSMSMIKARERTKGEGQSIASWVSLGNIPENATQWLLLISFWPEMVSRAPLLFPNENIGFQLGTLLSQTNLRCSSKKERYWATRNLGSNLWKKALYKIRKSHLFFTAWLDFSSQCWAGQDLHSCWKKPSSSWYGPGFLASLDQNKLTRAQSRLYCDPCRGERDQTTSSLASLLPKGDKLVSYMGSG